MGLQAVAGPVVVETGQSLRYDDLYQRILAKGSRALLMGFIKEKIWMPNDLIASGKTSLSAVLFVYRN